jgi:polygalacturonase
MATAAGHGPAPHVFNVRDFGAVGDGATIDSPAINKAIDHAASLGGGTVYFPPGTYACYTLRLKSNITLHLGEGAVVLAAAPNGVAPNGYDDPGPGAGNAFQDYGHSHWNNSLIFGEGLHDVVHRRDGPDLGQGALARQPLPRRCAGRLRPWCRRQGHRP